MTSIVESGRWIEQTPAVLERGEYFDKQASPLPSSKNASVSSKGPDPLMTSEPPVPSQGDPKAASAVQDEAVDYTPPNLITALITESGVHTPSAVSEELIKIWY